MLLQVDLREISGIQERIYLCPVMCRLTETAMLVSINRSITSTDLNHLAQMRAENLMAGLFSITDLAVRTERCVLYHFVPKSSDATIPVGLRADSRSSRKSWRAHFQEKKLAQRARTSSSSKVVSTFDSHITRVFSNVENR